MADPVMISPAGFIGQYVYPSYPFRGLGGSFTVVPQAPNASLIARGIGEFDVSTTTANQGNLNIQVTPSTHTTVAVAFLVDNAASPKAYCGVALDASNRPYVIIKDVNGTTVGLTTPSGAAVTAGTPLSLQLSWSSTKAIRSTHFAYFKVNGSFITEGDWTTYPSAAWTPFVPTALLLGVGNLASLGDFNASGTSGSGILSVQVSNSVTAV